MTSTWRITTALRVFALATVVGQTLAAGRPADVGVLVLSLLLVASAGATLDVRVEDPTVPWSPVAEAVVAGVLVAAAGTDAATLMLYLAVPAVVAGVRSGRLTTLNAALAGGLAFGAEAVRQDGSIADLVVPAVPWMLVGLASGLLAAHLTRSMRRLAEAQAPLMTAHRLVTRLSAMLDDGAVALDATAVASDLLTDLVGQTGARSGAVDLRGEDGEWRTLRRFGPVGLSPSLELPLRTGDHHLGRVVLWGLDPAHTTAAKVVVDERAMALETALLIEDVRTAATSDERRRLARDLHDGAAQRVVALGWMLDELAATGGEGDASVRLADVRAEVDRLVDDLRLSLFDLHQDLEAAGGLPAALADYARELSARSDLRVHLTLDEQSPGLPESSQIELLRIAQEAIGNVHRHARAINLWVSLTVRGPEVRLVIEDDGIGGAAPRPGHYGLAGMTERATRLGAELSVGQRADGGTRVEVCTCAEPALPIPTTKEVRHELRPAGR